MQVDIDNQILDFIEKAERSLTEEFKQIDRVALLNQNKVLKAFQKNNVSLRHFNATSGYGYDDIGRDNLCRVFADVFNAEKAIVSPLLASGTHTLTVALFGILRPNDLLLSISGEPYDTLTDVISGKGNGSLYDFGVSYDSIPLLSSDFDYESIKEAVENKKPKMVFIGRSKGYEWRDALTLDKIANAIMLVKEIAPQTVVMVDNCYGEFLETIEPTDCGADIVAGSLIKNIGGGIAPTGGYIAGKAACIEQIANRLIAPSVGMETGSYARGYREFYQGLFLAPHTVANALKGSMLFGNVFNLLGKETLPKAGERCGDIIRSIKFDGEDELIKFCQAIQKASPVDSNVVPYPWDMPGYENQVIMAAGTFIEGASIELSADSPIKKPYIAYLQGGLTYEHIKIALIYCLKELGYNLTSN